MININITDLVPYLTHFVLFKNIKKKNSFKFQSSVTDDRSEKGRIKMDWHTVPDSSHSLAVLLAYHRQMTLTQRNFAHRPNVILKLNSASDVNPTWPNMISQFSLDI